jgi:hypothetical protein
MARILFVTGKPSDLCVTKLEIDGKVVKETNGYVPDIMPEDHCGDYIELEIDIDTGMLLNWKKPTKKELAEYMKISE